jgi:hypothetical protein
MIPSRTELNSPTPLFHLEHPAAHFPEQHYQRVGDGRTQPVTTDLFSTTTPDRKPPSPSASTQVLHRVAEQPRYVLPRDLPSAIKHLNDQELDRLIAAVLAEQKLVVFAGGVSLIAVLMAEFWIEPKYRGWAGPPSDYRVRGHLRGRVRSRAVAMGQHAELGDPQNFAPRQKRMN